MDNETDIIIIIFQNSRCAEYVEDPDEILEVEPLETKNFDINVFSEESPSKVKNNFVLERQEKIHKPNVDLVFNRNDLAKDDHDEENKLDEDEIAIAKMTSYLKN